MVRTKTDDLVYIDGTRTLTAGGKADPIEWTAQEDQNTVMLSFRGGSTKTTGAFHRDSWLNAIQWYRLYVNDELMFNINGGDLRDIHEDITEVALTITASDTTAASGEGCEVVHDVSIKKGDHVKIEITWADLLTDIAVGLTASTMTLTVYPIRGPAGPKIYYEIENGFSQLAVSAANKPFKISPLSNGSKASLCKMFLKVTQSGAYTAPGAGCLTLTGAVVLKVNKDHRINATMQVVLSRAQTYRVLAAQTGRIPIYFDPIAPFSLGDVVILLTNGTTASDFTILKQFKA